jgi:hypothetical protein
MMNHKASGARGYFKALSQNMHESTNESHGTSRQDIPLSGQESNQGPHEYETSGKSLIATVGSFIKGISK